jgi:hypothetical protein
MAGIQRLVATSELKTNRLKASDKPLYSVRYHKPFDALLLLIIPPEHKTVVHYVDKHVGLVYEAGTLEIVGLQIEAFERHFLPEHDSVQRIWRLSDTGAEIQNFGDLILAVEKWKPKVAQEVVRAASDVLGPQAEELAAAIT